MTIERPNSDAIATTPTDDLFAQLESNRRGLPKLNKHQR